MMLTKHNGIAITADNPFAEGCLAREQPARLLQNLIGTIHQPFVLSINGRWGMGKTTFVRMLKTLLESNGHQCLYFNAWESDFAEDPFVALLGSIEAEIAVGEIEISGSPAAQRIWQKTKLIGGGILRRTTPLAIKIATHGILDLAAIQNAIGMQDGTDEAIASALEEYAKERINGFELEKRAVQSFRRTLAEFSSEVNRAAGQRGPVVIFVDELDRCRPSFAIQLLERIKHLFSVDGLVFVLAVDHEQLEHSVRGLYGAGVDAHGYLRRFIDLEYQLPEPQRESFIELLFEKLRIREALGGRPQAHLHEDQLRKTLTLSSELFDLSLRDLEQCATALNVVLRSAPPRYELLSQLLTFLVAYRAADREAYYGYMHGTINSETLIARLKQLPRARAFFEAREAAIVQAYLHTATALDADFNKVLAGCHNAAQQVGRPEHEEFICRTTEELQRRGVRSWLRTLVFEQLELIKQFQ